MPEDISAVLILGILLTLGFLLGIVAEKIRLPRIVAYIIVGAIFSQDLLGGMFEFSTEPWSPVITDIALGIIAYLVGAEINIQNLRKQEKIVFLAVLGQSLGALLFLSLGLWGVGHLFNFFPSLSFYEALVFGAIATATAPATSLGIIDEYKARGKMTNTLLSVIAVDDAIGIIFFTLILGMGGGGSISESVIHGFKEIGAAIAVGGVSGIMLGLIGKHIDKEDLRLPIIIGFIFLVFGISKTYNFSMLLSCMMLGFISEIFYPKKQADWLLPMEHIEELVFLFFFTLAGMHFKLNVLISSFALVLVYVVLRSAGKYYGAYAGISIAGGDKKTRRLLGLALLPQAGVAIGLAIRAANQPGFEEAGTMILNVILGSTIIFELTSPLITRYALKKAGDIKQHSEAESVSEKHQE